MAHHTTPVRRPSARQARLSVLLLALVALLLPACQQAPVLIADEEVQHLATLRYPEGAELGEPLDLIVVRPARRAPNIRLINRSAVSYPDAQLWLNQTYVRELDTVAVGSDNLIPLARFINRFEESYPTAKLLAPDNSLDLTSAEIFFPATGQRHPITVQPPREAF